MSENRKPYKKVRNSNNIILNTIGNICGWLSEILFQRSLKWGTWYKIDLEEDINKPEYSLDEIW